ncbi:MAG: hypothetical protein NZ899_13750 [Thermoguttaceae bacterium]|nr:hypothetical protein [Thermoguttaceae bacterium]MDW8080006.1 hypothetical protein [Thermoguttaceae bacterium]
MPRRKTRIAAHMRHACPAVASARPVPWGKWMTIVHPLDAVNGTVTGRHVVLASCFAK